MATRYDNRRRQEMQEKIAEKNTQILTINARLRTEQEQADDRQNLKTLQKEVMELEEILSRTPEEQLEADYNCLKSFNKGKF